MASNLCKSMWLPELRVQKLPHYPRTHGYMERQLKLKIVKFIKFSYWDFFYIISENEGIPWQIPRQLTYPLKVKISIQISTDTNGTIIFIPRFAPSSFLKVNMFTLETFGYYTWECLCDEGELPEKEIILLNLQNTHISKSIDITIRVYNW